MFQDWVHGLGSRVQVRESGQGGKTRDFRFLRLKTLYLDVVGHTKLFSEAGHSILATVAECVRRNVCVQDLGLKA